MLIAALLLALPPGRAQIAAPPTDLPPLRPSVDSTLPDLARKPPGARAPATPDDTPVPARLGQLPTFKPPSFGATPQPPDDALPIGIGSTGFDSRNLPKKSRKPAKPGAASANASPPTTISAARLPQTQNQSRHGAPPPDTTAAPNPGGVVTAATTAPSPTSLSPVLPQTLVRKGAPADAPFDPVGIQAGAFLLRPAIETSGGYDSNPARTPGSSGGSLYSVVAPELKVNSNWLRHELTADLHGSYTAFATAPEQDRPAFDGKLDGRIDVTNRTAINLESRLVVATDNPGSPNIEAGLARLPISTDVGGSAGLTQRFNRFDVTLKGAFDRTTYQESVFTDGSTASNQDRNFDQPAGQLRANYELTPGIKPFLELDADRRIHDLTPDRSGSDRDSNGIAGRLGTSFELSRILTGELAVGYLNRTYRDPTLPALAGPTLDSSLTWVATALTTVKFKASTTANETTVPGVSGIFTHEIGLEVDHDFRRWLTATLKFVGDRDSYVGSARLDDRYAGSLALLYRLTREWQVKGELRREWLVSNEPGNDYVAYVALLGVRWQR